LKLAKHVGVLFMAYGSPNRLPARIIDEGDPYRGPDLLDALAELAAGGRREVVVAPVGFIADHLEILYDIDIEARRRARELGIELQRTQMLNDDSRLAEALAQLVLTRSMASALLD
jgi:protoheme ferro-lyase